MSVITPYIIAQIQNSQRITKDGLVAHWMFDAVDYSGTIANDHSRYNNKIGMFGSPTNPVGVKGECVKFVAASSQWASASHQSSLDITGAFTIACWLNVAAAAGAGKYPNVIGKWDDFKGYGMYYDSTNGIRTLHGKNTGVWYQSDPYAIPLNEWHHVTGLYDGSYMRIYVDGASLIATATSNNYPVSANNSVMLARHYSDPGTYGYLSCMMDDARIYNRALTTYEISAFKSP